MLPPLATSSIGSLPHTQLELALQQALLLDIPAAPQLPGRDPGEYMVPQALEGLPGLRFDDLRHTIITAPSRNRMSDVAISSRLCGIRHGACWSITSGWRPSGRLLKSRKPRYDAR